MAIIKRVVLLYLKRVIGNAPMDPGYIYSTDPFRMHATCVPSPAHEQAPAAAPAPGTAPQPAQASASERPKKKTRTSQAKDIAAAAQETAAAAEQRRQERAFAMRQEAQEDGASADERTMLQRRTHFEHTIARLGGVLRDGGVVTTSLKTELRTMVLSGVSFVD